MTHDELTPRPEGAVHGPERRRLLRGGAIRVGAAAGTALVTEALPTNAAARNRPPGGTA